MPSRVRSLLVLAALLTLVATAALRFGAAPSDAAVSSTLHAIVNDNFDISLTFDDGSAVSALPGRAATASSSTTRRPTTTSTSSAPA